MFWVYTPILSKGIPPKGNYLEWYEGLFFVIEKSRL